MTCLGCLLPSFSAQNFVWEHWQLCSPKNQWMSLVCVVLLVLPCNGSQERGKQAITQVSRSFQPMHFVLSSPRSVGDDGWVGPCGESTQDSVRGSSCCPLAAPHSTLSVMPVPCLGSPASAPAQARLGPVWEHFCATAASSQSWERVWATFSISAWTRSTAQGPGWAHRGQGWRLYPPFVLKHLLSRWEGPAIPTEQPGYSSPAAKPRRLVGLVTAGGLPSPQQSWTFSVVFASGISGCFCPCWTPVQPSSWVLISTNAFLWDPEHT